MNDTSQSPFWNWKGWQTFKWLTGVIILIGVLFLIWDYNANQTKWLDKQVNWLMDKQRG